VKSTDENGKQIRSVSLTTYVATVATMLGILGTMAGILYGQAAERRGIEDRLELIIDDKLAQEGALAREIREGQWREINRLDTEVKSLREWRQRMGEPK
jgi:hypothetical protein